MDTENTPTEAPAQAADEQGTTQTTSEPDWKAEARKWESRAKANADAAKRLAEIEDSNKSEIEKAAERAKAAEERAARAETEALRFRIASEYQLSQEDAMALEHIGSEEGMRSVADRLRARVDAARPAPPPVKKLASGAAAEGSGERGRAAAALRTLRQG